MNTTIDQPIHSEKLSGGEVAPGVSRLPVLFVNTYFVHEPGEPWVLVDTGLPWFAGLIRRRAEAQFGRPPVAILLTHGHFDHAGNAEELAALWDVPVYAHPLEMPFLTGRSDYPPLDPTVGGAMGLLARSFPHHGFDLRHRVHPLPADGSVPGLSGWRWIHTPGHTAGHVSLFRESDRTLLAGDALATLNQDSAVAMVTQRRDFSVPPAPFTTDWRAARSSVHTLAELRPRAVAAGHGRPARGPKVAVDLAAFAQIFTPPKRGRYVDRPARSNEHGLVEVPPPARDPLPKQILVAGLAAGALFALAQGLRARSRQPKMIRRGRKLPK
jgi:glyoxylase-like metal-dependent hydrolase (beta-lactamase superfamily II)